MLTTKITETAREETLENTVTPEIVGFICIQFVRRQVGIEMVRTHDDGIVFVNRLQ